MAVFLLALFLCFAHPIWSYESGLIVALDSSCRFYISATFLPDITQMMLKKSTSLEGPCKYATITSHDEFVIVARYVSPTALEMAAVKLEPMRSASYIDLNRRFQKMDHKHVLNDCFYEREHFSMFIDFHILYIVATCGAELGALTRSIVYTDGKVHTSPGPMVYFQKNVNNAKYTFFTGVSVDDYRMNETNIQDSAFLRVDPKNNNAVLVTELHQLNVTDDTKVAHVEMGIRINAPLENLIAYQSKYLMTNTFEMLFSVRSPLNDTWRRFTIYTWSGMDKDKQAFKPDSFKVDVLVGVVFLAHFRSFPPTNNPMLFDFTSGYETAPWHEEDLTQVIACDLDDLKDNNLRFKKDHKEVEVALFVIYAIAAFLCLIILSTLIVFSVVVTKHVRQKKALLLARPIVSKSTRPEDIKETSQVPSKSLPTNNETKKSTKKLL
ncbi:hypothetical protein M3Y96_01208700 [Aphelenchoides besseyi]|nr:hypothetical protein M3Y96_01208700 [Aphelenchoides besseyi]